MSLYPLVLLQSINLINFIISDSDGLPIIEHNPISFEELPNDTFREQFRFEKEDITVCFLK